ncbi:MAG TPA: GNAT family protein [Gaiellaceae bacterium]|nr:GNAT family protein [Gaiellaceae bacterium]
MELRGERVVLRPLEERDAPRLAELGREPSVRRWWPGLTVEHLRAKARREGEEADVVAFAVVAEGELAGLIQYYEETEADFRHAGMDVFLGAPFHGRGLGTDAVRTLARHLVRDLGHHRLVIDPAAANDRAIRCYERVGFRRVGTMRQYWRDGDGFWRDGVLLDLLASELE